MDCGICDAPAVFLVVMPSDGPEIRPFCTRCLYDMATAALAHEKGANN